MYIQMAGLVFMPTGALVYVINYADLDRQHLARELDERYEPVIHWGDVPDNFSYRAPFFHRLRDGIVEAVPFEDSLTGGAPDVLDYCFHWRRLRLMDHVYAGIRRQRAAFAPGGLPLQDRLLDLALAECAASTEGPRPLLQAMAQAWGTSVTAAAQRVRLEHADRQHELVRTEAHRLAVLAQVRAARHHEDLDELFIRYGCHD